VARVKKSGGKARKSDRKEAGEKHSSVRGGNGSRRDAPKVRKPEAKLSATSPSGSYKVRELNAQQKCGQGTSVERLFRVDETGDAPRAHLVFLDRRHGWYCEHGVHCPAVDPARRIGEGRTTQTGRTHNGGMRA
jgi:hypothetical protein